MEYLDQNGGMPIQIRSDSHTVALLLCCTTYLLHSKLTIPGGRLNWEPGYVLIEATWFWSVFCLPLDLLTQGKIHSTERTFCLTMYGVPAVIVTAILLPLLGFVAVYLRIYTRFHLTSTYVGIDDWLSALSCLLVLGHGAAQIRGMILGSLYPNQSEPIGQGWHYRLF